MSDQALSSEPRIRWFDLVRFGAALKVIPNSPLRGTSIVFLEIPDEHAFMRTLRGQDDAEHDSARPTVKDWRVAMEALGFNTESPTMVRAFKNEDDSRGFRVFSDRSSYSLSQMQSVMHGLTAADFRPMPLSAVVHHHPVPDEMTARWSALVDEVLRPEGRGVWVPMVSPYEVPYAQARTIGEAVKQEPGVRLVDAPATPWFIRQLQVAQYRENALVSYYADLQAALDDGLAANEVVRLDLPYALPLAVHGGRIIALRDLRHAPEAMVLSPHDVLGSVKPEHGLVVEALRHAREVQAALLVEFEQWRDFDGRGGEADSGAAPGSFDLSSLNASVARVVRMLVDAEARFPQLPSVRGIGAFVDDSEPAFGAGAEKARVRPVEIWRGESVEALARVVASYAPPSGAYHGAFKTLLSLQEKALKQSAERARELARESLRVVIQAVQEPASQAQAAEKLRHVDVGEKIGGARKDFHRAALAVDDLADMNDFERRLLVVKKNVWPPLDYKAMREAGVTPQAAVAIKFLKDSLAVGPERGRHALVDVSPEADYVAAISLARDAFVDVRTLDEFQVACDALRVEGVPRDHNGVPDRSSTYGHTHLQVQWGPQACKLLGGTLSWDEKLRVPYDISTQISRKVKAGAEWSFLIKESAGKSDLEKGADAQAALREELLHRPHLAKIERVGGQDWRGGRPAEGDDFLRHFGFRAVEFGTWLPQDERQDVLNFAFDSFCDLADALDLPPKAVALDGKLAIAFGSRGTGGRNAAHAHFEPGRNVINLTRLKGAGLLAHEWFHAFDLHLGGGQEYATRSGLRRHHNDPLPALAQALQQRPSTPQELLAKMTAESQKVQRYALAWVTHHSQSPAKRAEIAQTFEALLERAGSIFRDQAVERCKAAQAAGTPVSCSVYAQGQAEAIEDGFRTAVSDRRIWTAKAGKAVHNNLYWTLDYKAIAEVVQISLDMGVPLEESALTGKNGIDTRFLCDAQVFDKSRSKPYWSQEIELFARAGAQFVQYALEDKGVRSDYLVYGADEARQVEGTLGSINPGPEDRQFFKPRFEALIDDYRVRLVSEAVHEDHALQP